MYVNLKRWSLLPFATILLSIHPTQTAVVNSMADSPGCRGARLSDAQSFVTFWEHSYYGVPITRGVHDNYCSANPCFIVVVTECEGGGAFLVLPNSVEKIKY
ncbi:hypothetical protein OYC64_001297 [Pagothenia borchgrevinki]|uniref:DUF1899 domain-containing protein n=1 Tax=Pagothenia borchgrevinki TaxID=8213 RepID=A0ABD2GAR3_PAGBO